jgi:multiple sugar transport system substrate-binding protein
MLEVLRRTFLKMAGLGAGALGTSGLLAACGGGSGSGGGGPQTVRYAWWGDNIRQQNYMTALELFQEENPDVTVDPEFADYTAFQERMTTQMAARDVPDIFWIAAPQVMTYEKNNLYRRLDDLDNLDLSDYDAEDIEFFELNGEFNTMPHGVFVPVVRYNESFLQEAGMDVPDGEGFTWDDLAEFLIDYTENNSDGRKGVSFDADHDLTFESWLRQHGQELWTAEGDVGFDVDGLAGWFDWWKTLLDAGAALTLSEQEGMQPDWAEIGDHIAARFGSSNHIVNDAQMFPDSTFRLRPAPELDGAADGHKFLYFPRLAIYQGIDDDAANAAAAVVNHNVNNLEFLKIIGLTMGAPPNPRLLQEAYDFASDDEQEMLAVVESETAADRLPRHEAPAGTNTWRTVFTRASEEIALDRRSVTEAAEAMIDEIQAGIDQER